MTGTWSGSVSVTLHVPKRRRVLAAAGLAASAGALGLAAPADPRGALVVACVSATALLAGVSALWSP
jgi:hypothetical protein